MSEPVADIVSLQLFKRRKEREQLVDPVIAYWKCRVGVCLCRIGVTQTAIDTLAMFNTELARRRERQITIDEVMLCEEHAKEWHAKKQEKPWR